MDPGAPPSFGDLLKRYRETLGMTQAQLAEQAGIGERTISDLERGEAQTPQLRIAEALIDAFMQLGLAAEQVEQLKAARHQVRKQRRASGRDTGELDPVPDLPTSPFIFVSHARTDRADIDRLLADLQARGITSWVDRGGFRLGTPRWERSLRTAIRACHAVLLVATPGYYRSRYAPDEIHVAEIYRRPIYPVWLQGDEWMECIPLGWGGVQYIDARGAAYESALRELVERLHQADANGDSPADLSGTQAEIGRTPRNPYKGLRPFKGEDVRDYFGREQLADALVALLHARLAGKPRLLALIGPSGSGKSSLVLAGVLPRLRQGKIPGSDTWICLEPLLPGAHPLEALTLALSPTLPNSSLSVIRHDLEDSPRGLHLLARRLARPPATHAVLIVDQCEELFTLTTDEDERRHFIDLLVSAITEPGGPLVVVLTLRADFYDRPMDYPALGKLLEDHGTAILPMSLTELRDAIVRPATQAGVELTFEGDLVGDILFDLGGQAGALPLLEFTLDQLFQRRQGRQLTLAAYHDLRGVRGALAQHAAETYEGLPSEQHRHLARALFLRLIDPGTSKQDTARRRAALTELVLPDAEQTGMLRDVVEAFIAARLLVVSESGRTRTVEVSHEALIHEWGTLAGWVEEKREDIRQQHAISADAAEWEKRHRPLDRLYRGTQLDEAQAWARRNTPSTMEEAFIDAAAAQEQREVEEAQAQWERELAWERQAREAAQRSTTRLRLLASGLIILTLVAFTSLWNAKSSASQISSLQAVALSGQLAAQSLDYRRTNLKLALLLSVQAMQERPTAEALTSLLTALQSTTALSVLYNHSHGVTSVAFSSEGKTLASGSADGTVSLWDVVARRQRATLTGHTGSVTSVALSPDGKTLASASADGTVSLWDVVSQRQRVTLSGHTGPVTSVAFSPDGKTLASGSADGTVSLWDVPHPFQIGQLSNGQRGSVKSVAFSRDGKTLASGSADGTVSLWDVVSQRLLVTLTGHTGSVTSVAVSPDGKTLASGSADGTVILWNMESGQELVTLTGHTGSVTSVAFSPDGNTLASGNADHTISLWTLWHVDTQAWKDQACKVVKRNLTGSEWRIFIGPALPYAPTCPPSGKRQGPT
jgi:WD40 repeat protein/transcriptional regulator with XRE-family HTH domain